MQNLPDPNRAYLAKEGLTFFTSRERENPDVQQIGPDLLAVGYLRRFHPLDEFKRLRLRRAAGIHRSPRFGLQPTIALYSDPDNNSLAIAAAVWRWSHGDHRPGRYRRAVQLQPLGSQGPERCFVVIPGVDDLVHHPHPDAEERADEALLSPAPLKLAYRPTGLAADSEGQEAVAPPMPARLEAARHALGSQRLESSRQQDLLSGTHSTSSW